MKFVQIIKGEMSITLALLKNRIRFKGDKMKALHLAKPIDKLNEFLNEIETEYEEM